MVPISTISKTDLARHTRQVVDRARRGDTIIVKSYGEEQVVVDAADYRFLRAIATHQALPSHPAPANDPALEPAGLSEAELKQAEQQAGGSLQDRWNKVIAAYLDGHINLGRAAVLFCPSHPMNWMNGFADSTSRAALGQRPKGKRGLRWMRPLLWFCSRGRVGSLTEWHSLGCFSDIGTRTRLSRRMEADLALPGYEFQSYLELSRPPNRACQLAP